MSRDADVVIIGAGVMGLATARSLARRGRSVVVLERFRVGHDHGSSHGTSRIFRLSYDDPAYVRLAREALTLWRAAEEEAGEPLITMTGGVDTGPGVEAHADALAACGVAFELVTGSEAMERYPALALDENEPALLQADAGIALADRAVASFARSAVALGADIREEVQALALRPGEGSVEVATDRGSVKAEAAVVTAGAWARELLATAGIELPTRPTRETVAYFRAPEGSSRPVFLEWTSPAVYALPAPGRGLKAGEHQAGPTVDPDVPGEPDGASVRRLAAWVAARFPGVDPEPLRAETCLYTNAPEDRFLLERHGPVVVGSACSGHGFKFAPVIGERLASLADEAVAAGRPLGHA